MAFPDKHRYTMHMLIAIHLMMGCSAAGVTLATGNIGLKLAPKGEATAYLAVLSLVNALAAGIAPIVGGLFADFFADRELALVVQWFSPERSATVPLLSGTGDSSSLSRRSPACSRSTACAWFAKKAR